MKIAGRIFLSFSTLTVLATLMVGLAITYGSSRFIKSATDSRIVHTLDLLEHELTYLYDHLAQDTEFLSKTLIELNGKRVDVENIAASDRPQFDQRQLAHLFRAFLRSRPTYFKLTLTTPQGQERVRISRLGGHVVETPERQLQASTQPEYIQQALQQQTRTTVFSRIALNRNPNGQLETPPRPVLNAAKVVYTSTDQPLGVIIISVGMKQVFNRMRTFADEDAVLILACAEHGELIMHPDPNRTFGNACGGEGETHFIQQEIPSAKALVDGSESMIKPSEQALQSFDASLGRLRRLDLQASPSGGLILGVLATRKEVHASIAQIHRQSAMLILSFAIVGFFLSFLLERRISGPLRDITHAVRRAARGEHVEGLPLERHDEIGTLARRFDSLIRKLNKKINVLNEQELRMKGLIQSCNDAILEIDEDGRIEEYNRAAQAMFGYARDEVIGHNWRMLLPHTDGEHAPDTPWRFVEHGDAKVIGVGQRVQGLHKDGRLLNLNMAVHPFEFHEHYKFTATLHRLDADDDWPIATPS